MATTWSEQKTPSKARAKKFHSKVATGCQTCRERRIKCDQTRPECLRCVKSGHACKGYDTIRRVTSVADATKLIVSVKKLSVSPKMKRLTAHDASFFDYTRLHILPNVIGPFDKQPWFSGTSPMFLDCPSVYHAAVALGALICVDKNPSLQDPPGANLALQHYSRAIEHLSGSVAEMQTVTPDVIVLTALLFIAFELHQSRYEQAKTHLGAVLRFVNELREDSSSYPEPWRRNGGLDVSLSGQLDRLDIQMSAFTSTGIQLKRRQQARVPERVISSDRFRSIEEACHELTTIRAAMRELLYKVQSAEDNHLHGIPPSEYDALNVEVTQQLIALDQWDTKVLPLRRDYLQTHDELAIGLLQAQQLTTRLQVANCLNDGRELLWDASAPNFEHLLDRIEYLLAETQKPCTRDHIKESPLPVPCMRAESAGMYLDSGLITAAYLTALKCRIRPLRRRALEFLDQCHHREGTWHGPSTALQARKIVHLEEKDLSPTEPVPERCRLHRAWFDLDETGTDVIYCKRRLFESTGEWCEYTVDTR